jgi:predicted HAD superfamily Cof-like phosphohydrolase
VNPIMEPEDAHPMEFVREFMLRFGQAVPPTVSMPDPETHNLRWRLIDEEAQELRDATSLVQYLDAVGDLLYVVYGAAIAAGFTAHQIEAAVYEIHRSNMSKLWSADEIDSIPADCRASHVGDGRYIVRRNDGKVIKSPTYSPANLQPIIE